MTIPNQPRDEPPVDNSALKGLTTFQISKSFSSVLADWLNLLSGPNPQNFAPTKNFPVAKDIARALRVLALVAVFNVIALSGPVAVSKGTTEAIESVKTTPWVIFFLLLGVTVTIPYTQIFAPICGLPKITVGKASVILILFFFPFVPLIALLYSSAKNSVEGSNPRVDFVFIYLFFCTVFIILAVNNFCRALFLSMQNSSKKFCSLRRTYTSVYGPILLALIIYVIFLMICGRVSNQTPQKETTPSNSNSN